MSAVDETVSKVDQGLQEMGIGSVKESIEDILDFKQYLQNQIPAVTGFCIKVVLSIIVFFVGRKIIRWILKVMRRSLERANVDAGVIQFASSAGKAILYILLIINILLLFVGTFMDMTPACLIFTPIFLPVCTALGMNTVHFGIMMIFNLCIGTITPPVGTTLFVGVKVGKVKIETVFRQLLLYFAAIFAVLLLVTYIPQLSLWLPSLMGYV